MGTLRQPIHHYPYRIYSTCGPGKFGDKIHGDVLPFPHGNIQRLHLAVRSLVLRLDLPAGQAPLNVPSDVPLHAGPPIIRSKISIHLRRPWMDRKSRLMSLVHQYLPYPTPVRYPHPTMKRHQTPAVVVERSYSTHYPLALLPLLLETLHLSLLDPLQQRSDYRHPHTQIPDRGRRHLAAQGIGHHVGLPWMIQDLTVIVLQHVQPSPLSHIQTRLIHKVSQTLVVRVDSTADPIQIMSPNLEGKNNCPQLQVVGRIISLVRLQLSRSISHHMASLHQHCSHTCDRSITIDHEILNTLWQGKDRSLAQSLPESLERRLLLRPPTKNYRLLG